MVPMKKFSCLLMLCFVGLACAYSQTEPVSFFQTTFTDLKSKNADGFVSHVITGNQFKELLNMHFRRERGNQDLLDKIPATSDSGRTAAVKKRFLLLVKQA